MASSPDTLSMALFCDFENVALGVRDAKYEKFDIKPVLERLLLKGSIVVKKAYCDWDRYKAFKATMHEANFELIEIPHVRQSGKNSADIRLVVDALDLCYTKSHVNTFVIISGDSDFSPLVSKLRGNAKPVIAVRVKKLFPDEVWKRRQRHVVDFERMLAEEGTTIVKIFLHISKEEQAVRLQERLDDAAKHWKFAAADLAVREHWDDYQAAYEEAIRETSTDDAPWYVIPADRKWYRNWAILQVLLATMQRLDPQFPPEEEGLEKLKVV